MTGSHQAMAGLQFDTNADTARLFTAVFTRFVDRCAQKHSIYSVLRPRTFKDVGIYMYLRSFAWQHISLEPWRASKKKRPKPSPKGQTKCSRPDPHPIQRILMHFSYCRFVNCSRTVRNAGESACFKVT